MTLETNNLLSPIDTPEERSLYVWNYFLKGLPQGILQCLLSFYPSKPDFRKLGLGLY